MIQSVNITQRKITARVTSSGRKTLVTVNSPNRVKAVFVGTRGPKGADGAGFTLVTNETPAGLIDGSNATFTTEFDFVPESVSVWINGLYQKRIADFNTSGLRTITLTASPGTGEHILVNYLRN